MGRVTKKPKMTQEMIWEKIAQPWRKCRTEPEPEVVEFLKGKKGKLLDLGCGSGRHFMEGWDGELYGVDFSDEMLRYAVEDAERKGIKAIVAKSGADDIPYENEFFDCAIYIATLHCIDSLYAREKSVKELYRVLKKGGRALVSVWSRNQKRIKNAEKETYVPWTHEGKKYNRYYYIFEREEFESVLKLAGFRVVKVWENDNIWAEVEKS